MKPFRIFLFGISILITLFIVSFLFSAEPLVFMGYTLKIPSASVLTATKKRYKNIAPILQLSKQINDTAQSPFVDTLKEEETQGVGPAKKKSIFHSKLKPDSISYHLRKMEYPPGQDTLLFSFFRLLNHLHQKDTLLRILHYGDSQIEGDRITSYLRNQLQMQFGGCGTGLLPVVATSPASMSYVYTVSDNWERYALFPPSTNKGKSDTFGPLLNYARIAPKLLSSGKGKDMEGWIRLKHSNLPYRLASDFKVCSFFYGYNKSPMMVELKQGPTLIDAELIPSSHTLGVLRWTVPQPSINLTIDIKTSDSPDVFGIALDGKRGVAVDNIPLRGCAGLVFSKMNMAFLHKFFRMENVKLLILEFGVNEVPNVTRNYHFYERDFRKQLTLLKKSNPDISVIVMGVSDVSRNGKDGFESYPNIEKIRDAQKKAAFLSGCAFWDMYEAMGGRNSMPSWVFANPPLARKDFIHFNPLGAKIMGEMFYRSFMNEYKRFLLTENKHSQ